MRMACTPWGRRSSCRTCTSCWRLQPRARHPRAAAACGWDLTKMGAQGCLSLENASCAWPAFHGAAQLLQNLYSTSCRRLQPRGLGAAHKQQRQHLGGIIPNWKHRAAEPAEHAPSKEHVGVSAAVCCEFEHHHAVAHHVVDLELISYCMLVSRSQSNKFCPILMPHRIPSPGSFCLCQIREQAPNNCTMLTMSTKSLPVMLAPMHLASEPPYLLQTLTCPTPTH